MTNIVLNFFKNISLNFSKMISDLFCPINLKSPTRPDSVKIYSTRILNYFCSRKNEIEMKVTFENKNTDDILFLDVDMVAWDDLYKRVKLFNSGKHCYCDKLDCRYIIESNNMFIDVKQNLIGNKRIYGVHAVLKSFTTKDGKCYVNPNYDKIMNSYFPNVDKCL